MNDLMGKVGIIPMKDIIFGDRRREDYGDLENLARSIKERGLIHPIAIYSETGTAPYLLLAGGRRFMACTKLNLEEVSCRIYDRYLTEIEIRTIELFENLDRKELDFAAECRLKREINTTLIKLHGEKISPTGSGHSMRDTASILNVSVGGLSEDLKLANAIDTLPHLELDKCKNKSEAIKKLNTFERIINRVELARTASKDLTESRLISSFIIKDFFEGIKEVPNEVVDMVELDPPYRINLTKNKSTNNDYQAVHGEGYNEVNASEYPEFIANVLKECYRVMKPNTWLILWFAPEPWISIIYESILAAGFKTKLLTGIWYKESSAAQCLQPGKNLANQYEPFFYCSKGNAEIRKKGRSNVFNYQAVNSTNKIHPTERPINLIEDVLETFSLPGNNILVPFLGSGNTLLAAFNTKRFAFGYELSKEYKDAFISRIIKETSTSEEQL